MLNKPKRPSGKRGGRTPDTLGPNDILESGGRFALKLAFARLRKNTN
jgi:hypothetical protein